MRKKVKRCLSGFLAVLFVFVTCMGNVEFAKAADTGTRKIDVWDFGGVQETDTDTYNNNITGAMWDDCSLLSGVAKFSTGKIAFGDLVLTVEANDRLYSGFSQKNYGSSSLSTTKYSDGYAANGMYYCNGTGGANRRLFTISNVKAGDKIVAYMGSSNAAESTIYFKYAESDKTYQASLPFSNTLGIKEFIAPYDGSYIIYTDSSAGKAVYNRIVRIPAVEVSGTIDLNGCSISDYSLNFTNDNSGETITATLSGTSFTVSLAAGETYTASLSGVTGYGFTNATKVVTTTKAEAMTGKTVELVVETKSVYTYTGKITGFDSNYDISGLKVILESPKDSLVDNVTLELDSNLAFSATLEPDVEYTVKLEGVNDYEVTEGNTICDNQDTAADITVAPKALYDVTGTFTGNGDTTVATLIFENVDDGYRYTATVNGNSYSVKLRSGSYLAVATIEGYRTGTHVVVKDGNATRDLLFVSTAKAEAKELVKDIYVGYPDKGELNYSTVKEAVAACAAMNPTGEAERITVHIAPGTYREQIIISTPYISFVNDTNEQVLLTWYYGIGYKYYSADASGYYNPENAYDKYDKAIAAKWGVATYVKSTATGFKAKGITFEASFNRYVTDEELEDGVEVSGTEKINVVRKYATDVTSKSATERATAFAVEAAEVELVDCAFLGSQDTLFTGKGICPYFRNCHIEGNTDYIFGEGNAVFDGCELMWYGYSDQLTPGYITAHRPADSSTLGYIFRNCTITANPELKVTAGYFGRPWGADAKVTLLNTQLTGDYINAAGWYEMSGNNPANANYVEYNTTRTDKTAVDLSGRVKAALTAAPDVLVSAYLGKFVPESLTEDDTTVSFTTNPYVVDNGDINAPYPGHTLTVAYGIGAAQINDASTINWYIVDNAGVETLVKTSTAYVDNTYVIGNDAIGKNIKVTVTPKTISGAAANPVSYTVEATVKDGFEDPTGSTDVEIGDGINIFLAGDSTVKDYSVNGMYMSGKAQNEGSWGEYLQAFFDVSKVKVLNYANGGRSTRNFINEGSLDKIAANIKAGDYLFIQFGHNDCSNASGYLEDRYVPLGTPDANGIYPVTAGTEVETPSSLVGKYGDTFYSYDCGGTYKWYLLQYINVARQAGAIPVLVTPVSRMYFTSDGTIRPHHDSTDTTTNTQVTSGNAYVKAVLQLAQEENVQVIDGFELTKAMYEEAYAMAGNSSLAAQLMSAGDSTHSNKLGGFLSASYVAEAIQDMNVNISKYVIMPAKVAGETTKGAEVFSVNGKNEFSAAVPNADGSQAEASSVWTAYGQERINAIGLKHDKLNAEQKNGLVYNEEDGMWYYYTDNVVDTSVTGFVEMGGKEWYVCHGQLDVTYKGLVLENEEWICVRAGHKDMSYSGLIYSGDAWWYVSEGKLDLTYSGKVTNDGGDWLVKNGKLDMGFTGLRSDGTDFWYVVNGKIYTGYTGLYHYADAFWYVENGKVLSDYTGFYENENGKWYVCTGKIDITFTGLALEGGKWLCVMNGKYYQDYTGLVRNAGIWWYVTAGELNTGFTGIAETGGSKWYVVGGRLAENYSGSYQDSTGNYTIENGKVIG